MAKKETIHVPARQLQVVRSNRTGLVNDLFPNETGWSEEDKTLFYKTAGGDVLPIGDAPIAIIPGGTKYSKIMALVNAGKLPVVKMVQGQGNKYMYPAWIGGSGTLRFSSTVFTNDSNVSGYWWADVPRSDDASWTYGYTALTGTEVLKLTYPDPVTSGITDEDYGKITGGTYKAILMLVGSGASPSVANLMVMGSEPKFAYFTYTIENDDVIGKMVVLSVSPTSVEGYHAVTLTNVPFGGGASGVPSFWKGAGDGAGVTIQDTTSHAIPISDRGDHTGDDITVADGNFVLTRGVYFWNFNIKLQRTGTSNAIQAIEAAFSDNSALIELDRTRAGDPLTYSFSGLLRIAEDNTAVGLTVTAGTSDALTASILRCAIFRINGVTEGEGGGGGEDNVIEGVQMPDAQSPLTPDANKIVHIPYAQPSSGSGDGVAGVITGAEKAKLNSLSGWLAGIVLGSDAYPFNPADGLEFAGGDGIGITLDDSDEIPKLKYEALYAAGLEMTNESHKRLQVRLGRGLQFDSTAGIELKLGKGLQFNESAGVDANALDLKDGAVSTPKIANANVTAEKLATDAVENSKIKDGAVSTPKIADANVTAEKLATDAVENSKIKDGAVSTPKIADDAITADKVKDNETLPVNISGRADMILSPRNPVNDYNELISFNKFRVAEMGPDKSNRPSDHWYHVFTCVGSDSSYATQIALGMNTMNVCYRIRNNGTWSSWSAIPKASRNGVGSSSIPVYMDSNGQMQPCDPTTFNIADGGVTTSKIAPNAVTRDKLGTELLPKVLPFKDANDNDLNGTNWSKTWNDGYTQENIGNIGFHIKGRLIDFTIQAEFSIQQEALSNTDNTFEVIVWHGTAPLTDAKIYERRTVNCNEKKRYVRERFTFITAENDNIKINVLPSSLQFNRFMLGYIQLKGFVF